MSMADDLHRASLLFQLFLHGLWMNTVQSANNWIRAHPLKKNKVENLKGTYFSARNTFFDFSDLEIGKDNCEISCGNPQSEGVQDLKDGAAKELPKKKKGMMFRKYKVNFEVNDRHAWDEDIKGKDTKQRRSRTLRLFGSRSTKGSNVNDDFTKPLLQN